MAQVTAPMAKARISILALATFDTRYPLVRDADLRYAGEGVGF